MSLADYHAAVEKAQADLLADKARLDWLDKQGSGQPWIARQSALGRGYRLHNFRNGEFKDGGETVRAAIDAAMKQEEAV